MLLDRFDILLIEDNPGDARLVRELLAETGNGTGPMRIAARLDQGLAELARAPADVVLLDLDLPDSQGPATVRRVQDRQPQLPIVVLSGLSDEDVALRAVQAGAQDYLVKGRLDAELLKRSVRYAIERKRLERIQRFLADAGALLASSLDYATILHQVAELAVSALADTCLLDIRQEDGTLMRVAVAGPEHLSAGAT
jgi:DNA-binding NtrC family response regulator